jgi:citrate lyase subunit beta/citryl-CoA lyase
MDFVSAHYGAIPSTAMRSPDQFIHPLVTRAKLEIAAACHAHGKVPSHNVTTDIRDSDVVADDAQRARNEFGYTRMWSIHPSQIQPIVQAFSPSHAEMEEAAQILHAAQQAAWGPIQHEGKLHDRASYRYYWTVLQRAKTGSVPLPVQATTLL